MKKNEKAKRKMLTLEFIGVMRLHLSDSFPEADVKHSKEPMLRGQDTGWK